MERNICYWLLIGIFLAATRIVSGQPEPEKVCRFSLIGMWRSDATIATNPIYFNFLPGGWVDLLQPSADRLPQDFEIITSMNYELDSPAAPGRLVLKSVRGNEIFPPGVISMEIDEHSQDSFAAASPGSARSIRWFRLQTHRYFLTLVARRVSGMGGAGSAAQAGSSFAMWTTLDGRQTRVEALGVRLVKGSEGGTVPVFEPIPADLYDEFIGGLGGSSDAAIRLELAESDFAETHAVFEVWNRYLRTAALPNDDPQLNGMEFLRQTAESLNRCGRKVKLPGRDDLAGGRGYLPLEYIKWMKKENDSLDVGHGIPLDWRPSPLSSGR